MSQVTQKQFEKALTVAASFFSSLEEVTTETGATVLKEVGGYQIENLLNGVCWKLGKMWENQAERFDKLKGIAQAQRRTYDGTEISLEKLKKITVDLRTCEETMATIEGAFLSAKGVYLEMTGREYGVKRNEPAKSIAGLEELDRLLGGTTRGLGTANEGEAGKVSTR